jgi:hypothetical protein
MSSARITYSERPDVTPETETAVLGAVYRFIIDCHAKKNAATVTSSDGDDPERRSDEIRAEASIPER